MTYYTPCCHNMKQGVFCLKLQWKSFILAIVIPLAVGGLSALLTQNSMALFGMLTKPPLAPPGWLFPIVWTLLYILMGIASYLVFVSGKNTQTALRLYALQLAFNFLWSIFFFNQQWYLFSFFWLVALWILILATLAEFYRISRIAGCLLVPYLLWVTFAGYLNLGIYFLN